MMKSVNAVKPMLSKVNDYARNSTPQQISDFDLVSTVKTGQPFQKWPNSKVEILSLELKQSRVTEGEQMVAIHCWKHSLEAVEKNRATSLIIGCFLQ